MNDVEFGPLLPKAGRRLARRWATGAVLVAIAVAGSSCSMIDQFNPFGSEKYKMEITPDTPASKTYDQGLQKLANGAPGEAAKKFTDLGKQYPSSDWARKGQLMTTYAHYQAGDYAGAVTSAERYLKDYPNSPEAAYVLYLQANAYYMQIPDISRDQENAQKALTAFQAVGARNIQSPSTSRTRSTRSTSPRTSSPARKCRSAGSISIAATTPRPSIASATCFSTTRPPGMPKRRFIAWSRPISAWASPTKRRPRPRCLDTISPTASGIRTPITC